MMMPNYDDSVALKALFKQYMVGKSLEITPPSSTWIIVMPLRVAFDDIDCVVNLFPKLVAQLIRNIGINRRNFTRVFGCSGVDDQWLHDPTHRPQSFLNSSLVTPTTDPESSSADRFSSSSSSTQ
jgi:hypothetical protein